MSGRKRKRRTRMNNKTRLLCVSAVVGAAYAVLTVALAPISYGALQFRLSEALCILPYFIPGTAWGLAAGCCIANLMTGNIFDIIFGSLATLLAAFCTARIGRRGHTALSALCACLMPVLPPRRVRAQRRAGRPRRGRRDAAGGLPADASAAGKGVLPGAH